MPKVIILATSRRTRGGITSVVKAHEKGKQWEKFNCKWIETHQDKSFFVKLWIVLIAFFQYLFTLPSADLVHIHIGEVPSALRKQPFMFVAKILNKKTIVHFHSFSPKTTIRGKYSFLYKYLFCNANCVIVLSDYWKNEVKSFLPDVNVEILYNPCLRDISELACGCAEYQGPKAKTYSILFAGTINHRKGYDVLINAFGKIAHKYPDWTVVLAGNGEIEKGIEISKKLGIENQTTWLGWVNGEKKEHAFQNATLFCLPSYAEGFPMSVLDAWSYGLPVITTPVGGIPDIAIDGENMLLFPPGDTNALSDCLERLITDIELRAKISRASLLFARSRFNLDTINQELEDIYNKLLAH